MIKEIHRGALMMGMLLAGFARADLAPEDRKSVV